MPDDIDDEEDSVKIIRLVKNREPLVSLVVVIVVICIQPALKEVYPAPNFSSTFIYIYINKCIHKSDINRYFSMFKRRPSISGGGNIGEW